MKSFLTARTLLVVMCVIALGLTLGSATYASSTQIHGCVPKSGGALIIVGSQFVQKSCPSGMIPVSWNQAGLQGVQGPVGAPGPTGPMGPAGPQGLPGQNGVDGVPGAPGRDGVAGSVGPMGLQGLKGDTGERGEKGDKGDPGVAGPAGPAGSASGGGALHVYDANGQDLGIYMNSTNTFETFVPEINHSVTFFVTSLGDNSPGKFTVIIGSLGTVFYSELGCTGVALKQVSTGITNRELLAGKNPESYLIETGDYISSNEIKAKSAMQIGTPSGVPVKSCVGLDAPYPKTDSSNPIYFYKLKEVKLPFSNPVGPFLIGVER